MEKKKDNKFLDGYFKTNNLKFSLPPCEEILFYKSVNLDITKSDKSFKTKSLEHLSNLSLDLSTPRQSNLDNQTRWHVSSRSSESLFKSNKILKSYSPQAFKTLSFENIYLTITTTEEEVYISPKQVKKESIFAPIKVVKTNLNEFNFVNSPVSEANDKLIDQNNNGENNKEEKNNFDFLANDFDVINPSINYLNNNIVNAFDFNYCPSTNSEKNLDKEFNSKDICNNNIFNTENNKGDTKNSNDIVYIYKNNDDLKNLSQNYSLDVKLPLNKTVSNKYENTEINKYNNDILSSSYKEYLPLSDEKFSSSLEDIFYDTCEDENINEILNNLGIDINIKNGEDKDKNIVRSANEDLQNRNHQGNNNHDFEDPFHQKVFIENLLSSLGSIIFLILAAIIFYLINIFIEREF